MIRDVQKDAFDKENLDEVQTREQHKEACLRRINDMLKAEGRKPLASISDSLVKSMMRTERGWDIMPVEATTELRSNARRDVSNFICFMAMRERVIHGGPIDQRAFQVSAAMARAEVNTKQLYANCTSSGKT